MKKRRFVVALVCLVVCLMAAGLAGCGGGNAGGGNGDAEGEPQMVGAYGEDRALTDEDMAVFEEAMAGLLGVSYEPTAVSTQVVAGMNYCFTATATPVTLDPEPYNVQIFVFKSLDGEVELTDIVELD